MRPVVAMTRFSGLLLALIFTVTPTVDMVCRAMCTPQLMAAAAPSCHEVGSANADGALLPAVVCQRDAGAAVAPADGARNLLVSAPLVTAQVPVLAHVPESGRAALRRSVRPCSPHGYYSTTVLRI